MKIQTSSSKHLRDPHVRGGLLVLGLAVATIALPTAPAAAQAPDADPADGLVAILDTIFLPFAGNDGPGCAVGITRRGFSDTFRAYGMADLEHNVAITPETVFEAGSVSKQFTAAATILLALDGELSLDDDIRDYLPEVPGYGETITIRHLLTHTSGLRDWGSVAALEGWPRGSRTHTHEHMLDIVRRQQALNYPPGQHYSYTNTGYNLQAVLVERVSGMPFADFSRQRIFGPLGLEDTQWRDDYRRIVKGRAQAYSPADDGVRINMPYEDVHGNGGLLTTVGDLLKWTATLETGELAGQPLLEEMHRRGTLRNGRRISYASGLVVGEYKGVPEVSHGGATAGYRAYLARYPDQGAAVALLCNTAGANASRLAHAVADAVLGDAIQIADAPASDDDTVALPPSVLQTRAGVYRNTRSNEALRLEVREDQLAVVGGPVLSALSDTRFVADGRTLLFEPIPDPGTPPGLLLITAAGDSLRHEAVERFEPTVSQLEEYTGTYRSDQAEAVYHVEMEDGRLVVRRRFGSSITLQPTYPDAFDSTAGTFWFERDGHGRVVEMHFGSGRVWDMTFRRER